MDSLLLKRIREAVEANPDASLREIAAEVGCANSSVHKAKQLFKLEETPEEEKVETGAVALALQKQKLMDSNRVERKLFREEARKLNASNELFESMIGMLPKANLTPPSRVYADQEGGTLIVQFSDTHISETVAQPGNHVNTEILSKRLRKFILETIDIGLGMNVRRCVVLFTADLVNSDRRLQSEFLTNEMSRAQAIVIAFEVFSQAIEELSHYFAVTNVVSVAGNESRIAFDFDFTPESLINNGDFIIDRMLKARFSPAIKFAEWGSPCERIITIDGLKILVTHGITKAKDLPEKQLAYYRGKYGAINYAIMGHLHQPLVHPNYSRSGSPVGKNAYSELGLGIVTSCPSQTCYVVSNGTVKAFPIDLERADCEGYKYSPIQNAKDFMRVEEDLD